MEFHSIYRDVRSRLLELAATLSDEQAAAPVPACPDWTVRDVYAHLSGVTVDVLAGNLDGATTEDWTAAQVAARATRSVADIAAEWEATSGSFDAMLAAAGKAMAASVMDAWTHEQDIRGALRIRGGRGTEGERLTMKAARAIGPKLDRAGVRPLRIVAESGSWVVGTGDPGATLHGTDYEVARLVMGRRSRAQALGFRWEGDPTPYLEHLSVFPPPEEDLVE